MPSSLDQSVLEATTQSLENQLQATKQKLLDLYAKGIQDPNPRHRFIRVAITSSCPSPDRYHFSFSFNLVLISQSLSGPYHDLKIPYSNNIPTLLKLPALRISDD